MTTQDASALTSYRRQSMENRSAPELLIDLCQGAVDASERALEAEGARERKRHLHKARRIIVALQDALSFEKGGTIAVNLFRHYVYLNRLLLDAQAQPLQTDLRLIHDKLVELRDTWEEAVHLGADRMIHDDYEY